MKYDRIQETVRFITPGLYFLALVLLINFEEIRHDKQAQEALSSLSAIIVLLVPFVGFVVGFFIECFMTWIERGLYWIGVSRPSRKILHGTSKLYVLDEKLRRSIVGDNQVNSNKVSNEYQQIAKQHVGDNPVISRFYHLSIMARHIFGAHLIASVYFFAVSGEWSWLNLMGTLFMLLVLFLFWYHQNCVYMKYLFSEYGKMIKQGGSE